MFNINFHLVVVGVRDELLNGGTWFSIVRNDKSEKFMIFIIHWNINKYTQFHCAMVENSSKMPGVTTFATNYIPKCTSFASF